MSSSSNASSALSLFCSSKVCSCSRKTINGHLIYYKLCDKTLSKYLEENNLKNTLTKLVGEEHYDKCLTFFPRCVDTEKQFIINIKAFCLILLGVLLIDSSFSFMSYYKNVVRFIHLLNKFAPKLDYSFYTNNKKQYNLIFLNKVISFCLGKVKGIKQFIGVMPYHQIILPTFPVINKYCDLCIDDVEGIFVDERNYKCACRPNVCYDCALGFANTPCGWNGTLNRCSVCREPKFINNEEITNKEIEKQKPEAKFYYKHNNKKLSFDLPTTYGQFVMLRDKENIIVENYNSYDIEELQTDDRDNDYEAMFSWLFTQKTDDEIASMVSSVIDENISTRYIRLMIRDFRISNNTGALYNLISPYVGDDRNNEDLIDELFKAYLGTRDEREQIIKFYELEPDAYIIKIKNNNEHDYLHIPRFLQQYIPNEVSINYNENYENYLREATEEMRAICDVSLNPTQLSSQYKELFENILTNTYILRPLDFLNIIENYLDDIQFIIFNRHNRRISLTNNLGYHTQGDHYVAEFKEGYSFFRPDPSRPRRNIIISDQENYLRELSSQIFYEFEVFVPTSNYSNILFKRKRQAVGNRWIGISQTQTSNEIIEEN
jgi:hypothetical protein